MAQAHDVGGVVYVPWYATVLRQEMFAEAVAAVAPLALRYGATQYQVHRSLDDRYKITQMTWFDSKRDWYRYWEGPEMIEFRSRYSGKYQIPVVYYWADELAAGAVGPEVAAEPMGADPHPVPGALAP